MTAFLLDHLWQSTAMLAVVGLLTLSFRDNGAHVRHALWTAASVKFLIPFAALTSLAEYVSGLLSSPLPAPPVIQTIEVAAQPFSGSDAILVMADRGMDWLPMVAAAWVAGVLVLGAFWFMRWRTLRAALRAAYDADISAPMSVKFSPALLEPGLVGIFRPTLLLPEGIVDRLTPSELQAILAHEACHLRRRDNLTAALHMLVEAIFWFWPPVWWLGARLVMERERACDEAVVACGYDPQVYAESILKVCKFYVQSPLICAAGVSGADLKKRMEEIMRNTVIARLSIPKKTLLLASAAAMLVLPLALGLPNVPVALAQAVSIPSPLPHIGVPNVPVPTARPLRRIASASAPVRAPAAQSVAEPPAAELSPSRAPLLQVAQLPAPPAAAQAACVPASVPATHTRPPYPAESYRNRETGTVEMRVTVANDGKVNDAVVTRSSGVAKLDEAAMEHVRDRWEWSPSACGGFQTMVRIAFAIPAVSTILPWTPSSPPVQTGDGGLAPTRSGPESASCPLVPLTRTATPYPPISRRMGETGTVEMRVTVLPEGFASDVVVTRSSGVARLDDAARVDVGSMWRWRPRGECTPTPTMVRVVFSLLDAH